MFWYSFLQKRKASGGRVVSRTKKKYVFEVCLSQSFLNSSKSISDDWLIGICWNSFLFASYIVLVPWITLVWWIPKNIFYQWYWVKVFIIYHISNYIIIYYQDCLFICWIVLFNTFILHLYPRNIQWKLFNTYDGLYQPSHAYLLDNYTSACLDAWNTKIFYQFLVVGLLN